MTTDRSLMITLTTSATEEDTHMARLPTNPDANADTHAATGVGPDRESAPGAPRWVMILGIVALIVVLLFVVIMLVGGGGGHGPGRHIPSSGHTPPSSVTAYGAQ